MKGGHLGSGLVKSICDEGQPDEKMRIRWHGERGEGGGEEWMTGSEMGAPSG